MQQGGLIEVRNEARIKSQRCGEILKEARFPARTRRRDVPLRRPGERAPSMIRRPSRFIDGGGMLDFSVEKLRGLRVKTPILQFADDLDPLRGIDDFVGSSRRDHRPDQQKRGLTWCAPPQKSWNRVEPPLIAQGPARLR